MHSFMNIKKSARISNELWDVSVPAGMADMVVAGLRDAAGDMSSAELERFCSLLKTLRDKYTA